MELDLSVRKSAHFLQDLSAFLTIFGAPEPAPSSAPPRASLEFVCPSCLLYGFSAAVERPSAVGARWLSVGER